MDRTIIAVVIISVTASVILYKVRTKQRASAVRQEQTQAADRGESCRPTDLKLSWPVEGTPGRDWVVSNYVDADASGKVVKDYTGATGDNAITYNAHAGIDIELASFHRMDQGYPAMAAADGVVEEVFDQSPDRNLICSEERWNFVRLRHANGFATVYGHMKKNSVRVKAGDRVARGTKLADIGSSGCSAFPHLHFEVQDCAGGAVDPIQHRILVGAPEYAREIPAAVMEAYFFQPAITTIVPIQDSEGADTATVSAGHPFSIAATLSGFRAGDVLRIELTGPEGGRAKEWRETPNDRYRTRSHWWHTLTLDQPGRWSVAFKINGRVQLERPLVVSP